MRKILFLIIVIFLISCSNHSFDTDMRQIAAKDEIAAKIPRARQFNVLGFSQDTLSEYQDTAIKKPIRYSLDITYKDSNNIDQRRKGIVLFSHDGNSIISSQIIDSLP